MKSFLFTLLICLVLPAFIFSQWTQQNSGTQKNLHNLFFLNENLGWVCGYDGTILKATDGGVDWTSYNIGTMDDIHAIFFIDSLRGWAVLYEYNPERHGSVIHTTDGGVSWNVQFSEWGYTLHSISFIDENNGWVAGSSGAVYHTSDGGNLWIQQYPATEGGWLWPIFFFDNNVGWTAGDPAFGLFKSTDGGNNWVSYSIPMVVQVLSIDFLDYQTGWLCGAEGQIVKTVNGGLTWQNLQSSTSEYLRDIYFVNYNIGWCVGHNGTILYTNNGGNSWSSQMSNTSKILRAVQFINGQVGWVVGENGVILKTTNGGGTLEQNIFEKTYGGVLGERGVVIENTVDGGFIIGGSTASFTSSEDMYLIKLDSLGSIQWSKVYNSFGYDRIHGIKQINDGGYYITGYVGDANGLFDMAFARLDANGNIVWSKSSGNFNPEEFRKLSLTADGGLLASGYNASIGLGAKDVQAMKIGSNGVIEWAKTYGTVYEDWSISCLMAEDGNYILAGESDITGNYDIRPTLIKLDTLGNIIWAKYYSGNNEDWGRDLIKTPDSGFLLAGETTSYGYGGSQDIYLIKTDGQGNVDWARAYGGIGEEMVFSVILTSDSKFLISGSTASYGFGGFDAFLMKVTQDGSVDWFHTFGGNTNDYGYDVVKAIDQGYALTGRRSSNTLGGDDVYLVKTDMNGVSSCAFETFNPNVFNIQNLESINLNLGTLDNISSTNLPLTTINPNSGENNSCATIPVELKSFNYQLEMDDVILIWSTATEINNMGFKVLKNGNEIAYIVGAGTTTEPRNYSFKDENLASGVFRYDLLQIDFNGQTENIGTLEIEIQNNPDHYSLEQNYPNPFNPITMIRYSLKDDSKVTLDVYDVLGNKVKSLVNSYQNAGIYEIIFDGSDISSGIYFYHLKAGQFTEIKKLVLIK